MQERKIEYVSTAELIPYARNSRTHSDEQIAQIAASIKEFGFTNPVLIDGDNGIIAGHGRVIASQRLKLESVPCIRLSDLSEVQRKAYVIADNKIALNAGWDDEMLKIELQELDDMGFDLELTGFTLDEIGCLDAVEEDNATPITEEVKISEVKIVVHCSAIDVLEIAEKISMIPMINKIEVVDE